MQSRREFIVNTAKAGLVTATLGAVGCGGGSGGNNQGDIVGINTNFNGSLSSLTMNPAPGAVFIGRATPLQLQWIGGDPPGSFSVALRRFLEPIGGQSFDTPTQKITVTKVDDHTYTVVRRDNFDLDANAVYFLDINASGGQQQRFVFITGGNRSVTFNTGQNGLLSNVILSPVPGSYGISRTVGVNGFDLSWDSTFPPPSQFTVALRRFKEARGDDPGGDSEQETEIAHTDNTNFLYTVRRKNSFLLDGVAAYYLEITGGGNVVRAAYTTGT